MWHYRPEDGYFGDPIPFYWDNTYHLFYLKAPLEPTRHGADFTSYAHLSTQDFLTWKEHPLALVPTPGGPDAKACWTGSIIERKGLFYLFYTGHDPDSLQRPQSINVATSPDLERWEKSPKNPILLPNPEKYYLAHWRDPFVFWNKDESCYLMSITTMMRGENFWKAGALVMATSKDLQNWEVGNVFYNPGNHGFPECSDIFPLGKYWYLVASIFDKTCYRIGTSPRGPWRAGRTDSFDGVLNYAAKTIFDGRDRYVLGWIRTKLGRKDSGPWEWGGHLSFPRKLVQERDGSLYAQLPEQFRQIRGDRCYELNSSSSFKARYGRCVGQSHGVEFAPGQLYAEVSFPGGSPAFDAEVEFVLVPGTRCAGLLFNAVEPNHPGYEVVVDCRQQQLMFRKHGRRFGSYACQDVQVEYGQPIRLRVLAEGTIVEAFVNDRFALASSFYHTSDDPKLGFFVEEGGGMLREAQVYSLAEKLVADEVRS